MSDFQIKLPPVEEWRATGPDEFPEACLLAPPSYATIGKASVYVHTEAIAVVYQGIEGGGKLQVAAHDNYNSDLETLGGCFETIRLGAHDYVLRILPHED